MSLPQGSATFWCALKEPADKLEASWDDGSVIYDLVDGQFTALNPTSSAVLQNLRDEGCASAEGVGERLFGEKISSEESANLLQILEQLKHLGLVRDGAT